MTQDKIEQAEQFCEGERGAEFTGHFFPPGELLSLLREVAREQREICQKELDSGNPKVRNAPYTEPLNED